ncbi:MAG: RNA polymerase sigma factor, partial [Peptostreptococcaceae bacterium]
MLGIGANISRKIININHTEITKKEFVNMVEEHKISLYRFAKSILKNDTEVEDAISESILKAYKNKNKLKNKDSFKSWMMRIVANECYDLIKRKNRFDLRDNLDTLNLVHIDKEYSG